MKSITKACLFVAAAALLILAGCSGSGAPSGGSPGAVSGAGGQSAAATRPAAGAFGGGQSGGRRFATIPVQAVIVQSGPLVTDNDTAGVVTAVTQSQVAAQVAGVVAKVFHKQGDRVNAGEPVAQIDDSTFKLSVRNAQSALDSANINLAIGEQTATGNGPKLQSQLESAKNSLDSAQKNYDSQKAQYDLGGISASALDNAKSQLSQAQANVQAAQLAFDQNDQAATESVAQLKLAVDQATNALEMAKLNLQNVSIRAPFDGQLANVNVTPGSYLSLNSPAFLLVSTNKQIDFSEPPADAPGFKIGDSVTFTFAGKSYPVRITQTPAAPINGVVPMTASVPAGIPVSYGTVGTIVYKLTIGDGPQIPLSALQSRADINFVYTIQNGKAVEVPVIIIAEAGTTAVVRGLNAGDQVVLNPPPGLLSGSTVQVVAAPQAAAPAAVPQGQKTGQAGGTGGARPPGATGKSTGGGTP